MEEFKNEICSVLMLEEIPEGKYASTYICAYDLRKKWQQINHPRHLVGMFSEVDAVAFANVMMEIRNEPYPVPTDEVSARMDAIREWYA